MTLRVAFWWSLIFVSFVFVGAVKSRPVKDDDICRIIKRGDCDCQCYEATTTIWGSLADLYKRLFVRSFARPVELEVECSKCTAECKRHIKANCLNGKCVGNNCGCSACWKGKACDQPDNDHSPKFEGNSYKIPISANTALGSVVAKIKAEDEDSKKCTKKDAACPCGDIIYSITNGNEAKVFDINKKTGELRLLKSLESYHGATFEMTITAENTDEKQKAEADVLVTVMKTRERRSPEHHHVVRRSTPQESPSGIITVSPVIINNTFYKPGDMISFNFSASHNQSVGTSKPTENVNFKCSSPSLAVVSGLSSASPSLASNTITNGELLFSLTAFGKSTVLKGNFDATVNANMHPLANLYFSCEATGTTSGTSYKIGPFSSTPPAYGVFPKVSFTRLTSPSLSTFNVDSVLHYKMVIDMPKLDFPLLVEVTSAINDFSFMALYDAKVTSIGTNIGTGVDGIKNPVAKYHKSSSEQTFYDRATLDFKNLTVSAESNVDNKIEIEWKVNITDHPSVSNGSKYWNGAGLSSGSNMLHVAQQAFYAVKIEPTLECTITPKNNTVVNRFSIDDIIVFDTECSHTNTSSANAKEVVLKYYSTYLDFESSAFALTSGLSPVNPTNFNKTMLNDITFPNLNQGVNITGTLVMKVRQDMNPLVELNLYVKLAYKNDAGKAKMTTTHKPKPAAIAAVPVFSLNIVNKLSCYRVGSILDLEFKILLRKINSPLQVEIIAPTNASAPIMAITEVSTPVIGSNILNSASLANKPIICKSTVGDTLNDRCTINFGDVTSITGIANAPTNEISIKFKVLLNDHDIINNGSKYWPAVGVRGGSRMMWIGEVAANVCLTADPKPILKLEAICYDPRTGELCCNGKLKRKDVVQFNLTISHDNQLSEQHANQVKIIEMLPPYVTFQNQVFKSPLLNFASGPVLTTPKTLRFLDKLSFSYLAQLDPTGKMPTGDIQATSIAEVTYVGRDTLRVLSRKVGVCCIYNNPEDPSAGKPAIESSPHPEWYNRGFLVIPTSKTVFVCSENVADISCFYTSDGGGTWNGVNEQVGRIIGNVGETLYAISANKRAYMKQVSRSDDWYAISENEWASVKASASSNLKTLSDSEKNDADPTIILTDSDNNEYGGNKLGIYFKSSGGGSWTKKALWKCCDSL